MGNPGYTYNPEKARQLLAEAGYPDGFEFEVTTYQAMVDILSVCKEYFKDIGVEMTINQVEEALWWAITGGKEHKQAATAPLGGVDAYEFWEVVKDEDNYFNYTAVEDPYIQEKYVEMGNTLDLDERNKILKELVLYWFGKASYMSLPVPYQYTFWQPWLKGQSGEYVTGVETGFLGPLKYAWVDQELKKEMGH